MAQPETTSAQLEHRQFLPPAAGLLVATALAICLGRAGWFTGRALTGSAPAASRLDEVVAILCLAAGALTAAWYAATCLGVIAVRWARVGGRHLADVERWVRHWGFPVLRKAVMTTAAAGAGASLALAPATATTQDETSTGPQAPVPADLGWGATDAVPPAESPASRNGPDAGETTGRAAADEATGQGGGGEDGTPGEPGPAAPESGADTAGPTQREDRRPTGPEPPEHDNPGREAYRVEEGDSLWSIAAAHLEQPATPARIAAAWPDWYETNRSSVGADPDTIHPGLVLRAPTEESA